MRTTGDRTVQAVARFRVPGISVVTLPLPPRAAVIVETVTPDSGDLVQMEFSPLEFMDEPADSGARWIADPAQRRTQVVPSGRTTIEVASGVAYHVAVNAGFSVEPTRFAAPAHLRIRRVAGGQVRLRFAVAPVLRDLAASLPLNIGLRCDGGRRPTWPAEDPVFRLRPGQHTLSFGVEVSAQRGTIEWDGQWVEPGFVDYDLDISSEIGAPLRVRESEILKATARVVVEFDSGVATSATLGGIVFTEGNETARSEGVTLPTRVEVPVTTGDSWLIVPPDEHATGNEAARIGGPIRLASREVRRLRCRLGGWIATSPNGPLPVGARVEIRRRDGAPFVFRTKDGLHVDTHADVAPGLVLGPFVPGAQALDVYAGGRLLAQYRVEVHAQRYAPLQVDLPDLHESWPGGAQR